MTTNTVPETMTADELAALYRAKQVHDLRLEIEWFKLRPRKPGSLIHALVGNLERTLARLEAEVAGGAADSEHRVP